MKLSISLPDEDVEFLDEYGRTVGAPSRSAVLQRAVRLLRANTLAEDYAGAWEEWDAEGHAEVWEPSAGDGLEPGRGR